MRTFFTGSPEETIELAVRLAELLEESDMVALRGNLGSGKTVFVKGLAKGLGVKNPQYVNSPSFVIMKEYHGSKDLYHFDVYRLEEEEFRETIDYERYFYNDGITVVEWADKIKDLLPEEFLEIKIEHKGRTERNLEFTANGKKYEEIIEQL